MSKNCLCDCRRDSIFSIKSSIRKLHFYFYFYMIFNIELRKSSKADDKVSIIQHDQLNSNDHLEEGLHKTKNEMIMGINSTAILDIHPYVENVNVESGNFESDENVERGNWIGKCDFILSSLGYAVGLGNVWRFPYMCYRNGGGAFMIPYLLFLFLIGIPIFLVDVGLGQFTSNGPFTCWQYAPLFTGIGYAMVIISTMVAIYYNVIIAYSIYYMFASISNPLPWVSCNNTWNTPDCRFKLPLVNCSFLNASTDGTCVDNLNNVVGIWNESLFTQITKRRRILPAEEYFNNEVLQLSSDITIIGAIQWKIALCLFGSWIIVFLCLIKGIRSSGKVVYFTAIFPYVVLLILFVRGILLDGAVDGILFYIVPDIKKLGDASVWKDAANQIFFSLSASWGGLIALSSYNRFHNNIMRDTFIVSIGNSATSIFAGFVIFSYLGYLAKLLGTSVSYVAEKGTGLAFIIYPEAVATMPGSYIWSFLFFFMLITLGLDSQFTTIESVITGFVDVYPIYLRPRKRWFILIFVIILFILGLPLTTKSGPYWLQLMDTYCGGWAVLLIGIFEVISIGWVYGRPGLRWGKAMRFKKDIETMLKRPISNWWRLCWQYITPFLMSSIILFSWFDYSRAKYGDKVYPLWADFLGWMMTLVSLSFIPGTIIYLVVQGRKINPYHSIGKIFHDLTLPTYKWGPSLFKHRLLAAKNLENSENYYIDVARRLKYVDFVGLSNQNSEMMTKSTFN